MRPLMMILLISSMSGTCSKKQEQPAYRIIAEGAYCGIGEEKHWIIRDSLEWKTMWEQVYSGQIPQPDLPEIDFQKKIVVGYFSGTKSSGGYSLELSSIVAEQGIVQVVLTQTGPGKNCIATMALTQPFLIVVMDTPVLPEIRLTITRRTNDCN